MSCLTYCRFRCVRLFIHLLKLMAVVRHFKTILKYKPQHRLVLVLQRIHHVPTCFFRALWTLCVNKMLYLLAEYICTFKNQITVLISPLINPWLHCIFKCIYIITEDILWYLDVCVSCQKDNKCMFSLSYIDFDFLMRSRCFLNGYLKNNAWKHLSRRPLDGSVYLSTTRWTVYSVDGLYSLIS